MLRPICLLPLVAAAAMAQQRVVEPARATAAVTALLESAEPADVAWGAYRARQLQLRVVEPELRSALSSWTRRSGKESLFVRHYLLDALIGLEAELPGEEIAPQLVGQLEPLALILMARDPEAHAALLFGLVQKHWLQGDSDVRLAAGNLLANERAPGFAAWLMRRLPLRLHVTVRDVDPTMIGVGSGGAGASMGVLSTKLSAAYPPVPRYHLTTLAAPLLVLLAPGGQPVYFGRRADAERHFRLEASSSSIIPPTPAAHRWLMEMAKSDPVRLGLPLHRFELVRWRDADSYVEQVVAWRTGMEGAFAKLSRRLVIRGAMTKAEEEQLSCLVELEIEDERVDRTVALPEIGKGVR